jgi:hypothetical protein
VARKAKAREAKEKEKGKVEKEKEEKARAVVAAVWFKGHVGSMRRRDGAVGVKTVVSRISRSHRLRCRLVLVAKLQ